MLGMPHRLSVTNARCEAADGPSPLKAGEQERLQKEQPGRMLRSSHECQAKDVRKGGRKAMKSDGKRRGSGWTSVTGETLIPRETPMRTLRAGLSLWRFALVFLLRLQRSRRKHDGLRTKQLDPPTPDATAWPITPKDWERSGFGRKLRWKRLKHRRRRCRNRCVGRGGPYNGTHLPRLERRCGFLTLRSQRAGTAMARASAVDHAHRAIPLRSALLHR